MLVVSLLQKERMLLVRFLRKKDGFDKGTEKGMRHLVRSLRNEESFSQVTEQRTGAEVRRRGEAVFSSE
jgi:hypothetical protein